MGPDGWPSDPEQLALDHPEVSESFRIYSDPSSIDRRQLLEALVISGDEPARIAERLSTDPQVSVAFECLFFDVRDLLRYPLFVSIHLIGNLSTHDPGAMMKAIGYARGGDAVMRYANPRGELTLEDRAFISQVIRKEIAKNALKAALSVRVNKDNAIALSELHLQYEAAMNGNDGDALVTDSTALTENLEAAARTIVGPLIHPG